MVGKEIKNVFGWLNEITVQKSSPDSFSDKSWDNWNSYMVHRFLSMNFKYLDIVNYVQKINPQNKKEIYTIYKQLIPKRKIWNKYIKNQNKQDYKELVKFVSKYFEVGNNEAFDYIPILGKEGVDDILNKMGIEDKERKKLIKTSKIK
jgi:hypothetical protein|tara:strand:- start:137 stop:580 length:444 start_codon:yes stop_codon:yes gene_type:complete